MSKIEDALKKAKDTGKGVVPFRGRNSPETVPVAGPISVSPEQQRVARDQISRMRRDRLLASEVLDELRVIHPEMNGAAVINAFRELRTKLVQRAQGRNVTVMVTAVCAGAGSSFVARNLAAAFALDESKTALLIDCNVGSTGGQDLVPGVGGVGLTDFLESDELPLEQVLVDPGIPRLRYVSAGTKRESATEYLTSPKMAATMAALKQRYAERYVVLDAPPIGQSADARVAADLADLVVVVVPYGRIKVSDVEGAVRSISAEKFAGVVFNDEPAIPPLDWRRLARESWQDVVGWLRRGAGAWRSWGRSRT